ncbi:MAG: DUF167 domain-containing protein [Candidatus Hadarchaeota archaeon]
MSAVKILTGGPEKEVKYEVEVKFHQDFLSVKENRIIIGLTSRPERGKANLELVKKLAKHFGIPSSNVRIVSGVKSRRKIVGIRK